ncbi:MAG TPA: MFS transporter, partial [Arenicellales bacterium]|nr:MFS transporter [Arenicellales bacterium]
MSVATASSGRREIEAIAVIGFGHGVSHFFHLMIPPLFPWLMRDFGLSFTQAGLLTAVFFTVSGVGQAAAGFVVDRLGAWRVLVTGMGLFAAAGLILAAAPGYAVLILAAAVAGAGNCVFHPADFTLLNRNVSSPRLGHAFSVHGLSGNIGWALAPVFMTGITVAAGWRVAALAAAAVALLAMALYWLRREAVADPVSPAQRDGDGEPEGSIFAFLGVGAVWMCFLFFFLVTVALAALQNFGPVVLHEIYGMSLAAGASALTAFLFGGAAGMVVGGFLVARYASHDRIVALVLVMAAGFALAMAGGQVPAWSIAGLMAAMGFCTGMAGPSRDMLVRRAATARFGQAAFGRVYGFVYSGLDTGFAVAPALIFGPLMDADQFT